jgi:outer membrane autotransporter protein
VNHGVLSPGNSPGTIQIGGNFVQSSSGLLISEIRRDGTDLVDVVGTATLAGTHEIHIEYGLYLDGATRTLLQAAGGVGGTFSTVAINPSALMFADHAISVTTETVSFTRLPTTTVTEAGTNRGRYAEWLDEQIAGGALTPDLESYVDLLLQQPTAGEAFGLLGETAEPVIAVVQNSIATLGAGAARAVFGRFAANDSAECTVVREASAMANCAWVQGMRQSGDAEGDQFGPRYDWDTNGAQFGFDRKFSAWTLGFMLGYADTDTFDVQGGRNDTSSKLAGAYANYSEGSLDISALALYGANDNRTRRSVEAGTMFEEARAEFDSDSYGVGARFSYRVGAQSGALLRPFAEVFYDHVDGADLTEGGSATGDLTARIHDRDGLRATAGFQWAHNFEGARRMFRPSVELGMAHQFKDTQATLDLRPAAAADSAPTFRSYGLDLDSTSYVIDAALDISLGERASLAVGYSGELGSDYAQRELNVGFRVVW